MNNPIWLLAMAGALAGVGPVMAQDASPSSGGFQSNPMMNLTTPRVVPTARTKEQQSVIAQACANADGSVNAESRVDTCSKLIDSGAWKGAEIAWAYANRCAAFIKLGQQDKALADCDKAVALDEKNAVAYQARGMILQDRGDNQGALASFDKAIDNGANNAAIFSDRGNLLMAQGEADKALADYNKSLDINGKSVSVLIERGGAWLAKGKADQALADYSKAMQLSPNNGLAAYYRGVAFYLKGDKAKASEDFKLALKLDPKNAYPGLWLFLARTGADGKADLQRYSAKFAQDAWPWPVVQYDLGASDAQKMIDAAKTPGDQCEAQFYIGAERLAKGSKDQAMTYLAKAAEICPKNFLEYIEAAAQLKALGADRPKKEPAMKEKTEGTDKPALAPKTAPEPANPSAPASPAEELKR